VKIARWLVRWPFVVATVLVAVVLLWLAFASTNHAGHPLPDDVAGSVSNAPGP
jgi:hypothetical protein